MFGVYGVGVIDIIVLFIWHRDERVTGFDGFRHEEEHFGSGCGMKSVERFNGITSANNVVVQTRSKTTFDSRQSMTNINK